LPGRTGRSGFPPAGKRLTPSPGGQLLPTAMKLLEKYLDHPGKGRAIDNIFVERLWRSVKYEYLYLQRPESCIELYQGLKQYTLFYYQERLHQSLDYKAPESIYYMAV
jgi:hypothetical protein